MTRILRLLMIAAVALPLWQPAAAQEVSSAIDIGLPKQKQNVQVAQQSTAEDVNVVDNGFQPYKGVKHRIVAKNPMAMKVVKVTKTRANVPEGYSQITLDVSENPWEDGSGYQMLLDANANTFGTIIPETGGLTSSGDASAATYAEFEYKIPENADGAMNTSNIIASGSASITIPAGTYDWCIPNPTPDDRIWIASTYGVIQGRYDNYIFESGFAYTFTISSIVDGNNTHDQVSIDITSNFENPKNLAVPNIYATAANVTWTPGGNETSWNVQYKKRADYEWITAGSTSSTHYYLQGLGTSEEYQVRVQGVYADGLSGWAMVTFTTNNTPAPACDPEDMGEITYWLSDTYADGWNNASISIRDAETNSVIQTLTMSSGVGTISGTVSICYGRTVKFVWTQGSYPGECSFTLADPDGNVIYSVNNVGSTIDNGETFATYTMTMPTEPVVKNEAFFEGKSYTWKEWKETDSTEPTGPEHTSNLAEIAEDPDQIIAMLRKVYMDKEIPGSYKRGYPSSDGNSYYGVHDNNVQYTGAGVISYSNSTATFNDIYGWNIPGTVIDGGTSRSYHYWYLDPEQYKPNEKGLTLLLLEMVDDFSPTQLLDDDGNEILPAVVIDNSKNGYALLREYFSKTIKSARVITEAKRSGEGTESGTLFKVDCNHMNKFYFISKGQMQWLRATWFANQNVGNAIKYFPYTEPCYTNGSSVNNYFDPSLHTYFFLGHMFEQFSPALGDATETLSDIYQTFLQNMQSFGVDHDCPNVPYVENGHHFMMYGPDSEADDCQNVRDMMFFIPDYRMMDHDARGRKGASDNTYIYQDYFKYHPDHQPRVGMFVIHQNAITGEQIEGQKTYKLHLTWKSNLLDFLPGEDGQYDLYRVIINPDGTKTYQKVGEFDPNTFAYDDNVPMLKNGQIVTYVVQGRDVDKFLTLQMSNEESFIIPGFDHAEQIRINLNSDYYFSRYDAAAKKNFYSNSLIANNTVGTNVKPEYIENGSQFKFWRATMKEVVENGVTSSVVDTENAVNFVTATVGDYSQTGGGTLSYGSWVDQSDFSAKPYGHGYHANPATSAINIVNGEVVFDGLKLYDNFSVDVEANTHPSQYIYYVTLETAVPFGVDDDLPSCVTYQGDDKTFAYFEAQYSDWKDVRAWVWNNTENFSEGSFPGTYLTKVGTNGSKTIWRWSYDGIVQPSKIIFYLTDGYNNDYEIAQVDFVNGGYYGSELKNDNGNYYILASLVKQVTADNNSNQARSNTVNVPVYKTEMNMSPISAQNVEDDVTHQFPAATKFDLDARYSSQNDILAYYIYRWADTETSAANRSIYESNGDDSSPQGQADNHVDYYTVDMNTDYHSQTVNFVNNNGTYADVTASFLDYFMSGDAGEDGKAQAADTYTYAPVVELFAPLQAVNLSDGSDRTDYNTYGGPQQMTAGGIVDVQVIKPEKSDYTWTAGGKTYRYYDVYLKVSTLDLPEGYQVAKVRAWRKIDPQYLGEREGINDDRLTLDSNGEYKFVDKAGCIENEQLGTEPLGTSGNGAVCAGTFGAIDVSQDDVVPMKFVVRVYFTKIQPSGAPMLKADNDQRYYIMETEIEDELDNQIPTSINGVEGWKIVTDTKYYNPAGIESDTPFKGVNIVVTRYSDGSTSTVKVLK